MKVPTRGRSEPTRTLVAFAVGEIGYAIDVMHVVQIINPSPTHSLPMLPPAVVGVMDFRGVVVPVIDLRQRFGLYPQEASLRSKWIIIRVDQSFGALVVDEVSDVFGVLPSELRPAPTVGDGDLRGLLGVLTHHGRMTFLLDLDRLKPILESAYAQSAQFEGSTPMAAPQRSRT